MRGRRGCEHVILGTCVCVREREREREREVERVESECVPVLPVIGKD